MVHLTDVLQEESKDNFDKILADWNTENARNFSFPDVAYTQRKPIFAFLLEKLNVEKSKFSGENAVLCLQTIRTLCREKMALDESFSDEKDVWLLFDLAYLRQKAGDEPAVIPTVRIEALKCLCNVIYNCPAVQATCKNAEIVNALVKNLEREAASTQGDVQVALLSAKILFLVTGFNPSMRNVAFQSGAITAISGFILPKLGENELDSELSECIIESLKAIFNVASSADYAVEGNKPAFNALTDFLSQVLLAKGGRMDDICFQAIAIMTLLPQSCFSRLIKVPASEVEEVPPSDEEDLPAIRRILDHFDYVLVNKPNTEHLVPIFVALTRMCRGNRLIRRFIRARILPPLHEDDVRRLPQEGATLRNRVCRLLTSSSMDLKQNAADFLFVLCKENVNRFIKYTGFGNAAGLLANRGLLGTVGGCRGNENGQTYSDDSEQSASDTEDYRNVRDEINPVTGRVDPPVSKNPFEGMSDEQKEYEAMQLVNAIDRLQRQGIMQPVRMADRSSLTNDGARQEPVEHVLQLRDEFLKSHDLKEDKHDEN